MNTAQAQQFAALQKATASCNNDARVADQMRRREADATARASEQNRRDEEGLRAAHGELGEEARKRKDLDVERRRCGQAAEADREAIARITSELNGIEVRAHAMNVPFIVDDSPPPPPPQADEREQKIQFVKEMEALNNENDSILTQREDAKLIRLLDAETADWLLEVELGAVAARYRTADDYCAGGGGNNEGGNGWIEEVSARVKEESAGLIEVEGRSDALTREANELETSLQRLRARFLLEHSVSFLATPDKTPPCM
jgi:hypothetical protein